MNMRSRVLLALRWSAGLRLISQVATWAMTLIVVRLLSPSDYGLMALASIVLAFLLMINELGIGPALVQKKSLDDNDLRLAFGIALVSNLCLLAIVWFASPLVAAFFEEPELVPIIRTLSIQFVLVPLAVIPEAMLMRNLDLKKKSIVNLVANVAGGVATLAFAIGGHGVWSLVWGSLVLMALRSFGYLAAAPYFAMPQFSISKAKGLLSFGALITADRLLWFVYSRADVILIGKVLGTEILGVYSVAMQIASLPLQKVNSVLNEVAFPAFAMIQNDPNLVRSYLKKATRMISFLAFPIFVGISSVAPSFVHVVLGEQWTASILPLATLACIMPLRMISNIVTSTLQGIGRVGISVGNLLYASVIIPVAIYIGSQYGLIGVCIAWLTAFPLVTIIEIVRSKPYVRMGIGDFLQVFSRPLLGSAIMWGCVYVLTNLDVEFSETILGLALLVTSGALVYFVFSFSFNRADLREMFALRSLSG